MSLHLIPNDLNIDFVGKRRIAYILSIIILAVTFGYVFFQGGLNYGIDFAGGATVHIQFQEAIKDEDLKASLAATGLPGLVIQSFGEGETDYLLRISVTEETPSGIRANLNQALEKNLPNRPYKILTLEMVGAKVGADLRGKALEAMFYATLLIAVYISGRFEHRWFTAAGMAVVLGGVMFGLEHFAHVSKIFLIPIAVVVTILFCWRLKLIFALGAIISILHDVLITMGLFAIMGREFDLTIIAALLTTLGYSLNDTIIVYDRIRENLINDRDAPLGKVINESINQTLSRTVLTSGTTLLVIICLLIWGGGAIFDFALVMSIGVVVGTLSSIFVASPVLLAFGGSINRYIQPKKKEPKRDAEGRIAPQV